MAFHFPHRKSTKIFKIDRMHLSAEQGTHDEIEQNDCVARQQYPNFQCMLLPEPLCTYIQYILPTFYWILNGKWKINNNRKNRFFEMSIKPPHCTAHKPSIAACVFIFIRAFFEFQRNPQEIIIYIHVVFVLICVFFSLSLLPSACFAPSEHWKW